MTVIAIACRRLVGPSRGPSTADGALSGYIDAIARTGAAALLVPQQSGPLAVAALNRCDGLLLAGGEDIAVPGAFSSSGSSESNVDRGRDELEFLLLTHARFRRIPVLGICRGLHVLNVASGGTIELVKRAVPSPVRHVTRWQDGEVHVHEVNITEGSFLASLVGNVKTIHVNGSHKYCVKRVGQGLQVAACSPDGVIEAIEAVEGPFCVGVQWHPESLVVRDDPMAVELFGAFSHSCSRPTTSQGRGSHQAPSGDKE